MWRVLKWYFKEKISGGSQDFNESVCHLCLLCDSLQKLYRSIN